MPTDFPFHGPEYSLYAKPESGIGFPGAVELVTECKNRGLKVAVASSADRIKFDANLKAAGLSLTMFDAIVSADAFENLKPVPDIFLFVSKILGVSTSEGLHRMRICTNVIFLWSWNKSIKGIFCGLRRVLFQDIWR